MGEREEVQMGGEIKMAGDTWENEERYRWVERRVKEERYRWDVDSVLNFSIRYEKRVWCTSNVDCV